MAKRNGLGKGLDALFLDNNTEDGSVAALKISEIEPNKNQPRANFDEASLRELADSIREHGVIQPLVVRPMESGGYQIVAGERRWRASRMAGLSEIPVVIRELSDAQTLQIAIIENLQREDLNPIELALGYKNLIEHFNMTQEQVADKVGKSRSVVANTIRMLSLPDSVITHIRTGKISKGHAKALLSLEEKGLIEEAAQRILRGDLLVRDIERLAKEKKRAANPPSTSAANLSPDHPAWGDSYYKEIEMALAAELGRKVRITNHGKKSTIELDFYSNEELADIAARLAKSNW